MRLKRIFLLVLDGAGVGELPDAGDYGDHGSNTLGNIARVVGGLHLPNLAALGLAQLADLGSPVPGSDKGIYGKMAERSLGKDTITGHWEIAGLVLERFLPVYPQGFPPELIREFSRRTGRGVIGNRPASGTAIIAELGEAHQHSGDLIIYTSADSVLQIAAHESQIPPAELYRYCQIIRQIMQGEHGVARVIARPFSGSPGNYQRTANRRDFALPPPGPTVLDRIKAAGFSVTGVGKISEVFSDQGLTASHHTTNNPQTMKAVGELLHQKFKGLVFANLIDFDMLYGHRNDPQGFARALMEVDQWLGILLGRLQQGDLLLITADHGNDPTTPSTDHSREYVPLLIAGPGLPGGVNLGIRQSFADIAASLCHWFDLEPWPVGQEFASAISSRE